MSEYFDLRADNHKASGLYKPTGVGNSEFRNVYRREDGSERLGPAWRDAEAAFLACEPLPGETFVEIRNTRDQPVTATVMGLAAPVTARAEA